MKPQNYKIQGNFAWIITPNLCISQMNSKLTFSSIFAIISVTEIVAEMSNHILLVYVTKPLIMVSILVYSAFAPNNRKAAGTPFFIVGTIFALLGDCFLMIREKDLFIPGLASFLVMQVLYAYAFYLDHKIEIFSKFSLTRTIPFLILALILFVVLELKIPDFLLKTAVGIYAFSIATMASMGFLRKEFVSAKSFHLVFQGALLFMLSDSLIAVDRFLTPLALNTLWVMGTYCIAQYLIVVGYLKTE